MSKKRLGQSAGYMEITDVVLAAVLISEGHPILECNKVEFGRNAFTFACDDDITEIRELYEEKLYDIEPNNFYECLQIVNDKSTGSKNDKL